MKIPNRRVYQEAGVDMRVSQMLYLREIGHILDLSKVDTRLKK